MASGRRALGLLGIASLLLAALATAGAEDRDKLGTIADGPPRPEPQSQSQARSAREPARAVADPWQALDAALAAEERDELRALAEQLGAPTVSARETAARTIRTRFAARAAGALLELASRDLDCERRLRERALVSSLVFDHFLEHAPN